MSLERVRKSLQIIFGIDRNTTTREPLIQERIQQEFVFDSKINDQHQNKFSLKNQARKKSNQYYYALDRLKSLYQNKAQSNEIEQIPVIAYLGDNTEKKLNLNMTHARWNQIDRFSDNESANFSSQFGEKLVQKSSNLLASLSKQEFRPYYVQEQNRDNILNQSQIIPQQHQNIISKSQKQQTIFGGNRSKVHFLREEKEQRSKSTKPESSFKRLGGILEDDFLIPSFLKDKNLSVKEVQSNNKFLEHQPSNFSSLNKANNLNESQFKQIGTFQQVGFNKINCQFQTDNLIENNQNSINLIKQQKQSQIRFWDKEPINEKNPFRIQNDDLPLYENKFKPPWQISNNIYNQFEGNEISENLSINDYEQQQEFQEKKSSAFIEQQLNISFGGCDINLSEDQKQRDNNQDEYAQRKPEKNSLIFDTFVDPKFNFENNTPQSKEKALHLQKQLDFSEQTPVFKQQEENKQVLSQNQKNKIRGESQISQTPRNNNFLISKGEHNKVIEQIQKNLSTDFNAQEDISSKKSNNNQLSVIQ